jgi:integrase
MRKSELTYTADEVVVRFLSRLPSTRRFTALRYLDEFANSLNPRRSALSIPWTDLSESTVSRALRHTARHKPPRTVNSIRNVIATLLLEEYRAGVVSGETLNSLQRIVRPESGEAPKLTERHVATLLRSCADDRGARGACDGAAIALILWRGLGTSELIALVPHDVKASTCSNTLLRSAIHRWQKLRPGLSGPFLLSISRGGKIRPRPMSRWALAQHLRQRGRLVGLEGLTPSDLRTFSILSQSSAAAAEPGLSASEPGNHTNSSTKETNA